MISCFVLFTGPIRNSHCPLVIGSFIYPSEDTYFRGFMDNVRMLFIFRTSYANQIVLVMLTKSY